MNAFELSAHLATCFDEDGVEYAIGGALALTAWAIPRDTKDVNVSEFAGADRLEQVFAALERAGVMVDRADAERSVARIGMFTGRSGRTLVDVFVGEHRCDAVATCAASVSIRPTPLVSLGRRPLHLEAALRTDEGHR